MTGWKRGRRGRRGIAVFALLGGLIAALLGPSHAQTSGVPGYKGSESCSACHADQNSAWRDSHHGWALRAAQGENILGDFDDDAFEHGGLRSRFFRRDGKAFVETAGPDGEVTAFEIKYTVGVEPLQQYLVELEGGRLQALDIAWDSRDRRWFHLYPDQTLKPGDGLHWSGPYKNWQSRCAVCHQTDFVKGYDPRNRGYQSGWAELTVGCEACHGPGEAHIAWAEARGDAESGEILPPYGLTVDFAATAGPGAATEIEVCAGCHSRRAPLGGDSTPPGARLANHYDLATLREGLYHADGQIDDEVYVLGSFLQSKMFARGVTCTNCHDPHSAGLRIEGDAVCTQCHNPQGRTEFPTLPKGDFDSPEHHKHPRASAGARCVACHMPAKTYMIVDPRRDHSFRVPRPDLSVKIGTPNACTACHADKTADWAAGAVQGWYPAGRWREAHFGEVLHGGRTRTDPESTEALLDLAGDRARPAIVRASAIQLLGLRLDQEVGQALAPFLDDREALVRHATVVALSTAPASLRGRLVAPRMTDAVRAVRLAAARASLDVPPSGLSTEERHIVERVMADLQASMRALADSPETQIRLGGLAMALRNPRAADAAFLEATRMDPQLTDAWMVRARIAMALNDPGRAAAILGRGVEKNPDSALLRQSRGNVLMNLGEPDLALLELREAADLAPDEPSIRIDIAALHSMRGDNETALAFLLEARQDGADGPDLLDLLAVTYHRLGRLDEARETARELARRFPRVQRRPELEDLLSNPD